MGRPLSFDRQTVLDRAMQVFWRQGYDTTSVNTLLSEMQIQRSSFYHAWQDKRSLFLQVLDRYGARSLARIRAAQNALTPEALRAFVGRMILGEAGEPCREGCLLVNTVLEQSGVDEELAACARAHLARNQAAFADWIAAMQAAGTLADDPDAQRRARSLMCLVKGARVMAREGESRQAIQGVIDDFFRCWMAPSSS